MESDGSDKDDDSVCQTRTRGSALVARIRRLTREHTQLIPLCFNKYGQATCDKSSVMVDYIGYLVRLQVPISYRDWRKVPDEIKNTITDTIMKIFQFPPNYNKDLILHSANPKWRQFKTLMGKHATQMKKTPPASYDYIDQDTWDEFLRQRCTKDFSDISARNTENVKNIKYAYRGSRSGYHRNERKMLIQNKKEPATDSIDRDVMWVAVRKTVNGLIILSPSCNYRSMPIPS